MEFASNLPDDAEEVDVCVVDGEIDEDCASATIDPQVVLQVLDHFLGLVECRRQDLRVTAASVIRDLSIVAGSVQLLLRLECKTEIDTQRFVVYHRPHYASCLSVCLPVCLVRPSDSKTEKRIS